ncbi:70-kilodalton heat shock protein, partial [Nowakowskiella sp. JEL0078]
MLGMHLGATNFSVSVCYNGESIIIPNSFGNFFTPARVLFTDESYLIGEAIDSSEASSSNSITDIKHLFGIPFDKLSTESNKFPHKIVIVDGIVNVEMFVAGEILHFTFQEIFEILFSNIKTFADDFLQSTSRPSTNDVVLAVPAYASEAQRETLKSALQRSGFNCLRIIKEPTAAVIAFDFHKSINDNQVKRVLVFRCGGKSSDVTIIEIEEGIFEVIAYSDAISIGGNVFDQKLADYICEEFKRIYKIDPVQNPHSLLKIQKAAEKAKISLSSQLHTSIEINSLLDGLDFRIVITRSQFEILCADLFESVINSVENILMEAQMNHDQVDNVILVGGSTHIPRIKKIFSNSFPDKILDQQIDPQGAIAQGAAIQADILSRNLMDKSLFCCLMDFTIISLGLEIAGGVMNTMFQRNSIFPLTKKKIFSTYYDDQTEMKIKIFGGLRPRTCDNIFLGEITLMNIKPAPRGIPQIQVTFDGQINYGTYESVITVIATEISTGKSESLVIPDAFGPKIVDKIELEKRFSEMVLNSEEDEKFRRKFQARDSLQNSLEYVRKLWAKQLKNELLDFINATDIWLQMNDEPEESECEDKKRMLKALSSRIFMNLSD